MTESFIREIAARFGLDVLKRITTGTAAAGFATFELSGPPERVRDCWGAMKDRGRGRDYDGIRHVDNPEHPERGRPFIECQSVYFGE